MSLTCLPPQVSQGLRGLGPCCRHRHQLVFSWLLVLHIRYGEQAHLHARARQGPAPLASQHDRRLRWSASWCPTTLRGWFADQAWPALRPPEDGLLSLVGDSTWKGKGGQPHPVAQNTRLRQPPPSVFGVRLVLLLAPGEV
jgi:hypothetical protein